MCALARVRGNRMASSLSLLTSKSLKRLVKLDSPFLQLPLLFDAAALAAEIAALPESAWRPHPEGHAGNSALPLIALGGDAANDGAQGSPIVQFTRRMCDT